MNRLGLLLLILPFLMAVCVQLSSILNASGDSMSGAVRCTLTREAILSLRAVSPELDQRTRMYVTSLGCARPRRGQRGGRAKRSADGHPLNIPVIIGNRRKRNPPITSRHPVLIAVKKSHLPVRDNNTLVHQSQSVPSLYVLNAAALTKSHAVEQLATDVANYQIDIAVITETHCKAKHTDSVLSIPGYTLQRRDRQRRRGGGVAANRRSVSRSRVSSSATHYTLQIHYSVTLKRALMKLTVSSRLRQSFWPVTLTSYQTTLLLKGQG